MISGSESVSAMSIGDFGVEETEERHVVWLSSFVC